MLLMQCYNCADAGTFYLPPPSSILLFNIFFSFALNDVFVNLKKEKNESKCITFYHFPVCPFPVCKFLCFSDLSITLVLWTVCPFYILNVPKFTATLYCICLSIPKSILKQMEYRFAVTFGTLSICSYKL